MKMNKGHLLVCAIASVLLACGQPGGPETTETNPPASQTQTERYTKPRVPDWGKNATIYEVNLRQYTPEGTFEAFARHLPRLKKMGVDILWFMPIHPISREKRKGTFGSFYAVADYKDTNPEHGTLEDFKKLVAQIHDLGMHVIIDWVPNHTGWDHPWITQHPDYYTHDENGNIIDPIDPETGKSWGWTDVADLNYDNPNLRLAMIDAMAFWVKECDIDGFRCDVAHNVPVDFWTQATDSLYAIEPLFMLAEAEVPALRNTGSFVMDYGWQFLHLMNEIAKGDKTAADIDNYLAEDRQKYSKGYHMYFTSNHDENTWSGTVFDRLGDGHLAFAVLAATMDGMPLIYSGQESANRKRLEFFEKDTIEWGDYPYADFYTTLNNLKHQNPALWNGTDGGTLTRIQTNNDKAVFAFMRQKGENRVVVVINLSKMPQEIKLLGNDYVGDYSNIFAKGTTTLTEDMVVNLEPWEYLVLSNQ